MTETEQRNLDAALAMLKALEGRGDLGRFFAPDVEQRELPNRLRPSGGVTRGLGALQAAQQRGMQAVAWERYEVASALARGDTVAIEAVWSAELKVPLGTLPAGGTMRAHLGMFMTFRDGLIVSQRNYDCFEPF